MKKLTITLLALFIVFVGLGVAYLPLARRAAAGFNAEVARIAASGAPATPADLMLAPIPAEANAAVKMREAYAWLAAGNHPPAGPSYTGAFASNALLTPFFVLEHPDVAARVLEHLGPYFELLEESAELTRVNWEINWDSSDLGDRTIPGLLEARKAVNAMTSRAVFAARDEAGDAQSVRDMELAFRLADHQDRAVLLSTMIWMACHSIVFEAIQTVSSQPGFDARAMRDALDAKLADAGDLAHCRQAVEGERARSVRAWRLHGRGLLDHLDGVEFLRLMQRLIDSYRAPYHEVESEVEELFTQIEELPWYCRTTRMEMPGVVRVRHAMARFRSTVARARVALAIATLAQENGRWPDDEDLAGMFPGGPVLDPLTGKPFQMREIDGGGLQIVDTSERPFVLDAVVLTGTGSGKPR